jgi:hypothetical protein
MDSRANIKAVISARDEASAVLGKFGDNASSIGDKVATAFKATAILTAVAGTAAVAFGIASVKAFSESEDKIAQTNAVLKSTGGIAGVTAGQVDKLAKALQSTTKYSDEDVRSVENLLLTFTSIGKDIFPQATKTVLDMATALGEDTKSASVQLGKALQDPILGITALRRVGVNFSDKQKDVIAKLVETNHKAEAQKLILKELQTEFGGSAEAAGNTFSGQLARLKNALNDVEEKIGEVIVKSLGPLATKALQAVAALDWDKVIAKTLGRLAEFKEQLLIVAQRVTDYLQPKFTALWKTILNDFVPSVERLVKAFGPEVGIGLVWVVGAVADMLNLLLKIASPVFDFLSQHEGVVWALVAAFAAWKVVLIIDSTVAAFQSGMAILRAETLLTTATVDGATAATGGLRLALLGVLGPWEIILGIIGVAAVLEGIRVISEEIDKMLNKATKAPIKVQNTPFSTPGNSETGLIQQLQKAFGGFRASGGPVQAGRPYVVGEDGMEMFVPDQSGKIVPNTKMSSGRASGPATTVNINVNAGVFMGTDIEARKTAKYILGHLKDIANSQNTTVTQMLGA